MSRFFFFWEIVWWILLITDYDYNPDKKRKKKYDYKLKYKVECLCIIDMIRQLIVHDSIRHFSLLQFVITTIIFSSFSGFIQT